MIQLHNLDLKRINDLIDIDKNTALLKALDKMINIIKDPEQLEILLIDKGSKESLISIYSSICIFIGEVKELISEDIDSEELSYEYMIIIRRIIENEGKLQASLFGGFSDLGYAINSIYKSTGYFKKFIDSFNKLIVSSIEDELPKLISNINNLKTESFDTMAGMTGVASYLLLYKDEDEIRKCIEEILNYLIMLTEEREVFGHKVPRYYLSPENHYSQEEREYYNKGSFNLGLSHGISGPLSILAISLMEGIEVEVQRVAIEKILGDLKSFCYINEKGSVYWPGRVTFDDYINKKVNTQINRASWCYGSPGIARAIYLAGKAINDKESMELSLKAMDGLCKMGIDEWRLESPTLCHGYAGLLAVIETMYIDTQNIDYKRCIDNLTDIISNSYKEDSLFGFANRDPKENENGIYEMVEEDNITLLQGAIGVILTLLARIKPITIDWEKHFLIR